MKTKTAILVNKSMADSIFHSDDLAFLASFSDFNPVDALPSVMNFEFMREHIAEAESIITCWGTPNLTDELIRGAGNLKFIMHAAGSVKNLIPREVWAERRCRVSSNAPVIAEAVAQTVLGFILCSLGQFWSLNESTAQGAWSGGETSVFTTKTINGLTVGIVGASCVGREVIKILKPFNCKILVHDPYLSPYDAEALGVTPTDLDTLIKSSDIVTLHTPNNKDCHHLINERNVKLFRDGTLFINTSRGTCVDEKALVPELASGRIFACLDVTDPEPPAADHPFRKLKNVILTPHIAGGHTVNGRHKLGRNAVNEIFNYTVKGQIKFEIREEMLEHMA